MLHVSCPELAAAISNAGGLGMLSGVKSLEELRHDIKRTMKLTDWPFGVNLPLVALQEKVDRVVQVMIEEGVKVVTVSAGSPDVCTGLLKTAGVIVVQVVATVDHAAKAEATGVDILVASGVDAGGVLGHDEVTTFVLVPQVVDAVKIPVVAAGGIGDGRGFIAALALGAEGIQMGTRFIATNECPVAIEYKQAILKATDTSTEVTDRGYGPTRCFRIGFLKKVVPGSEAPFAVGQVAGLIRDIPTAAELIQSMMHSAGLVSNRVADVLSDLS